MQRLWTEDEVSFTGDAVKLDAVRPVLRPVQRPHPPLWLAGHTEGALRRTARMGAPWIAAAAHVEREYLHEQVAFYRAACAEYGRSEPRIQVLQEIYVGESDESAVEDVRAAMTVKYAAYRDWGQDRVLPPSQSFDAEFDKLRRGRFILGGAASCRAQLADLIDHVAPENILLRPQWPGMPQEKVMASLKRLRDEVLP